MAVVTAISAVPADGTEAGAADDIGPGSCCEILADVGCGAAAVGVTAPGDGKAAGDGGGMAVGGAC